jgi:hypothetical protein
MKTEWQWDKELERKLIVLNDDQLNDWFKNNTIIYSDLLTDEKENDIKNKTNIGE